MAGNNILELLVRLKDEASAGLRSVTGNLGALKPVAAGVAAEFLNLRGNIAKVGLETLVSDAKRVTDAMFSLRSALAGAGFAGMVKSIVDVSSSFEGFESALTTVLGSSEKAKESMAWIAEFTAKTPYELSEVSEGFVKLSAYGLDATKHMKTLGDTASAMGKPMNMAVEAMADAVSFQFERLREFGVTASQAGDQVTFTWVQNGQKMTQTVQKTATDVESALLGIFSRFDGAMAGFSMTWKGRWSNLLDSVTLFKKSIGDAGLFDYLKKQLADVLVKIQEWKTNGSLDEWAKRISTAIQGVLEVLKGFAIGVGEMIAKFEPLIAKAVELAPAFAEIAKWVGAASIAVTALSPLLLSLASALGGLAISAAVFKGLALAVEMELITGKLADLITRAIEFRGLLTKIGVGIAAFSAGFAVGTWLNQFDSVKSAAQTFFGLMDVGYNQVKVGILEVSKAWAIAKGDFDKADAIQKDIDAQKEYIKQIEGTIKSINDEYAAKKDSSEKAKADAKAEADAVAAAEAQKKAAVQSMADFRKAEEKLQLAERVAGIKDEVEQRNLALQAIKTGIAESEQYGVITHAEAVEQKLNAEEDYAARRLVIAQDLAEKTKVSFGEESKEHKAAKDELLAAELDFNKQMESAAKQRIGLQKQAEQEAIQIAKEAAEEKKALEQAVSETREAELAKQIALIEQKEQEGVISHAEAVQQKLEAEKAWLQEKVSETAAAISQVAAEYGRDSAEYQAAVAKKIQADTALIQNTTALADASAAVKKEIETPAEMTVETDSAFQSLKALHAEHAATKRVISEPISMDINISPAQAALRSLAEDAQQTAAQAYKAMKQMEGKMTGSLVGGGYNAELQALQRANYESLSKTYDRAKKEWAGYKSKLKKDKATANTEFTGSSGSPTMGALTQAATAAIPAGNSAGAGGLGLKDMGKMEVAIGGKSGAIIGKPEVLKWFKEALTDEKRMGYAS